MHNMVDNAVSAGNLKILAAALTASGLVHTLEGSGPLTVFAPTGDAFAKLPARTSDKLLQDMPKLKSILPYRVVSGKIMSADVLKLYGRSAKTINGDELKTAKHGGVTLSANLRVTKADMDCSNGVIHAVDAALMPK